MKPLVHAKESVKIFQGCLDDYLDLHNFLDQTKSNHPDMRHRAILHSSFGIYLAEQVFGVWFTNSDGKDVSVRDVLEAHVIQDLGFIPTVSDYLDHLPMLDWLGGPKRKLTKYSMVD